MTFGNKIPVKGILQSLESEGLSLLFGDWGTQGKRGTRETGRASNGCLMEEPPPGTPLMCELGVLFEHSGVYLGNGRVAELRGDGALLSVSLWDFLVNGPRTGTRIFAACDAASGRPLGIPRVADNAKCFLKKYPTLDYHILERNCHRFTAGCVWWNPQKRRPHRGPLRAPARGNFMFERLEEVISACLNDGRAVTWNWIPGMTPGFRYETIPG